MKVKAALLIDFGSTYTKLRAVDVERDEVITAHARAPRAVDLGNDAVRELEGRVGGVLGGGDVRLAVFVPPLRDVRRAEAQHALHRAEQVVEHVAPVAQHVDDDAAAVLLAVVPRRPLRGLPVAL